MKRLISPTFVLAFSASTLAMPAWAQNHAEHYVLDGFGGVHAGGGAPIISPGTPYFGFDVAADLEFVAVATGTATGNGLLVLDKFGGVHRGGALVAHPPGGATPYFGFNVARGLTLRDVPPRAAGTFENAGTITTSVAFIAVASTVIRAPDDGFLVVTATSELHCSGMGSVDAEFSVALNGNVPPEGLNMLQQIPDCVANDSRTVAVTHLFPVGPGVHTVFAVGRRVEGEPSLTFTDRSITVIFVDRNANGSS
jgi:hypothetical protein